MLVLRWTRNVAGLVAAKISRAATRTTTAMTTIKSSDMDLYYAILAGLQGPGGFLNVGWKLRHLVHLPDLDHFVLRGRTAGGPFDGLFPGFT